MKVSEGQQITNPATGLNNILGPHPHRTQLGANGLDVSVDGAVRHRTGVLPGVFEKLVPGEHALGSFQEDKQQLVFVGG